ncbi:MAG: S-layer homology domain-containing protein [Nitriliruptoraceae bacterium]
MVRIYRRSASAVLASALLLATLVPGVALAQTTPEEAVPAAAGHLAEALVDGERIETTFDGVTYPDQGLTADVLLALAGSGVAADHIEAATDWLDSQAGAYTGTASGAVYAGAVSKLLIVTSATGRAPTMGDIDLVATLASTEDGDGRFSDDSEFGDFSNVITQSLGVIGLVRAADAAPSTAAVDYLAGQACADGGFPAQLDPETCSSDVDATGFAVQALLAAGEDVVAGDAVQWLLDEQASDGGLGNPDAGPNANSTGLAAVAFSVAGEEAAASDARTFLVGLQEDCTGVAPGGIRFSAGDAGDVTRATAQALPGLTGVGLLEVTADGAVDEIAGLDCPTRFPDVDYPTTVHAEGILELTRREVVQGRADGTFGPDASISRGQFASWFAGVTGLEPVAETSFTDIDGSVHAGAIAALEDAEAISGYGDGTFRPSAPVTRGHAASILANWLGLDPVEDDAFVDIADSTHRTSISAAAEADLVQGRDGRYEPGAALQRDQAASLLFSLAILLDTTS